MFILCQEKTILEPLFHNWHNICNIVENTTSLGLIRNCNPNMVLFVGPVDKFPHPGGTEGKEKPVAAPAGAAASDQFVMITRKESTCPISKHREIERRGSLGYMRNSLWPSSLSLGTVLEGSVNAWNFAWR